MLAGTPQDHTAERLFVGQLAEEYDLLRLVCPQVVEVSRGVGQAVARIGARGAPLAVFEIGCGTGLTSLCLLDAREDLRVLAVDNEPSMLAQARLNLAPWLATGRIELREADALAALRALPAGSMDVVASGYAVHNFLSGYRSATHAEIFRVLRPGGAFINGDRYGLDDRRAHLAGIQDEVRHWFRAFGELGRMDLLEKWVVHLFSDESPEHFMALGPSLDELAGLGFAPVEVHHRVGVNAVLTAHKPG